VSIEGGDPVLLTDKLIRPVVSPDGTLIAGDYSDSSERFLAVIPFGGGEIVKKFELYPNGPGPVSWTPDGRALTLVVTRNDVSNLWSQPLDGPPKQLTNFKDQQIYSHARSRDGKKLALSRGVVNRDVVLISGFR